MMTNYYIQDNYDDNMEQLFNRKNPKPEYLQDPTFKNITPKHIISSSSSTAMNYVEFPEQEMRQTQSSEERCTDMREKPVTKPDSEQRSTNIVNGETRDEVELDITYGENYRIDETENPYSESLHTDSGPSDPSYFKNQHAITLESKNLDMNIISNLERDSSPYDIQYHIRPMKNESSDKLMLRKLQSPSKLFNNTKTISDFKHIWGKHDSENASWNDYFNKSIKPKEKLKHRTLSKAPSYERSPTHISLKSSVRKPIGEKSAENFNNDIHENDHRKQSEIGSSKDITLLQGNDQNKIQLKSRRETKIPREDFMMEKSWSGSKGKELLQSDPSIVISEFEHKLSLKILEVEKLQKENFLMKEKLQTSEKDRNQQKLDLLNAKNEQKSLIAQIDSLRDVIRDAERNESSTESLQSRLEESESFISMLQNDKVKSRDRCHSAFEMLRRKKQEMENREVSLQFKINELEQIIKNINTQRDLDEIARKEDVDTKDKMIENLQGECSQKQTSITKLSEENERLKTKALELEEQIKKFITQKEDLEKKFVEVTEEHQIIFETDRAKLKLDEKKILDLKGNVLNITSLLETATEKNNFYEEIIKTLKEDIHVIEEKRDLSELELHTMKQKDVDNASLLRAERRKLEESKIIIENLKKSLTRKENFVESLQQELSDISSCFEEDFNSEKVMKNIELELRKKNQQCKDLENQLKVIKSRSGTDLVACHKDDVILETEVSDRNELSKENFLIHENTRKQLEEKNTKLNTVEKELNNLKEKMNGKVLIDEIDHRHLKKKETQLAIVEEELFNIKKSMNGKVLMNESAVDEFRERDKLFSASQKEMKSFRDSMASKVLVEANKLQEYQTHEALLTNTRQELNSLQNSMRGKVLVKEDDLKLWTGELSNARQIVEQQGNYDELHKKYKFSMEALKDKESFIKIITKELEDKKVDESKLKEQKEKISSLEKEIKDMKDNLVETKLNSNRIVSNIEKDISKITQEKGRLIVELSNLKKENANSDMEIDKLRKTNSEYSKQRILSEEEIERLSSKITSLEKSISITDDKIAETMAQLEKENKELTGKVQDTKREHLIVSTKLEKREVEFIVQSKELKEANEFIEKVESKVKSLTSACDDYILDKDRLTHELNEKEKEVEKMRGIVSRIVLLEDEVSTLKKEKTALENHYQKMLIDKDKQISISTQEKLDALNQKIELKNECQNLENQLQLASLSVREDQASESRIQSLEKMISKQREDASKSRKDYDEAIHKIELDLNEVTRKKNELSRGYNDLRGRNEELEILVSNLKASLATRNSSVTNASNNEAQIISETEERKSVSIKQLKLSNEEISKLKTRIMVADEQINSLNSSVATLTIEKERYNEKFLKVKSQLREAVNQRKMAEKKLQSQSILLSKAEAIMAEKNTATLNTIMDALNKVKLKKGGGVTQNHSH